MINLAELQALRTRSGFDELVSERFDGDVEAFLADLDAGMLLLLRTNLKQAAEFALSAQRLRKYLPARYRPRILSIQARGYAWSGDNRRALKTYRTALAQFLEHRDHFSAARLRKGLVEVYMYLGQYDQALEAGRQALRYFRRRGMESDVGQVLTNMGNVYHRTDRNRQALTQYNKARRIFEKAGGVALAIVDFNRANIYANLNQLRQAERLYQSAAAYYREAGLELAEAQARYSLAYLLFLEDRFTESLAAFEEVYETFDRLGDRKTATITMLDMAEINVRLNQYGSAILLGELVAPELQKLGMRYEEGKAQYFVGVAKLELGDYDSAAGHLGKAQKLFRLEKNDLWLGMIQYARARVFRSRRQFAQAISASTGARSLFRRSGDARRMIDADLENLHALYQTEHIDLAVELQDNLKGARLSSYQKYRLHSILGDHFYEQEGYRQALRHYKAAVRVVEKMISGLYQDEIRFFFAVDKYSSYSRVVECLLKLNKVDESFVQNLSALALINRRPVSEDRLRSEVPPELIERIDRLRAELNRMSRSPRDGERGMVGENSYVSAEQQLWHSQRKARAYLYPVELAEDAGPAQVTDEVAKHLGDRTLVNYYLSDRLAGAFVFSEGQTDFVEFPASPSEIQGIIRKLQFVTERSVSRPGAVGHNPEILRHYLTWLHDCIFEPIRPKLTSSDLIFIVHSDFAQIPFVALAPAGGCPLKDEFKVSFIVNPQDIAASASENVRFAACSNAVFSVPSDSLPDVEVEGREVKKIFGRSRLYLGDGATCSALATELERCTGFVHIAAHASRAAENPLFSRIHLKDGPFFPFDLFKTGVNARLVALSGCQTAAPGLYYGNSFSLAKAFCQAGSRYVLASLWPIADNVTMYFMRDFYARLRKNSDVTDAYLWALNRLQERTDNPAHWGAFVLLGI
ncbi:MAG: DUF3856 domain-containing protein [candidate division Zixibacteria bacterium]|nr:DUF3856 domain-containing protein [candidate division Zixibacteria bacterium]